MTFPLPGPQDLQLLSGRLDAICARLATMRDRVAAVLPEVQYCDKDGKLRIYTSLCVNLSAQLGEYLRLRRMHIQPYLEELCAKGKEDCTGEGRCLMQHAEPLADIHEAHASLREIVEHLQPLHLQSPASALVGEELLAELRAAMRALETGLNELLLIEESVMVPLMKELQRKIGAHD